MKTLRLLIIATALACPAFAWNCTTAGQVRVQVPAGTVGNGTGDGSGQVVVDNGLTFICEALPTNTLAPAINNTNSNLNTNTSVNTNTNANTNTNSNSNTNNNTLSQQQGQRQNQNQSQGQTQTANGGSATAANNGNGSNNNTTNVAAPKIPVSSAAQITLLPSAPCVKNYGGSAQTAPFGVSLGGGKIDEGCDIRETARSFSGISKLAQCKLLVNEKESKKAGVTLADCMGALEMVVAPSVAPAPIPDVHDMPNFPEPQAVIQKPAPVIVAVESFQGIYLKYNNVTKARLDGTILLVKNHPDSHLRLRYNPADKDLLDNIVVYLANSGVDKERIEVRDDGYDKGVEVIYIN